MNTRKARSVLRFLALAYSLMAGYCLISGLLPLYQGSLANASPAKTLFFYAYFLLAGFPIAAPLWIPALLNIKLRAVALIFYWACLFALLAFALQGNLVLLLFGRIFNFFTFTVMSFLTAMACWIVFRYQILASRSGDPGQGSPEQVLKRHSGAARGGTRNE